MADITACLSTGKDDWETPDDLFAAYNQTYHFVLDAAANKSNTKVDRWFGPGGEKPDALVVDWPLDEGHIWLNPPYSRPLQGQFVSKAIEEVNKQKGHRKVICLLPARTDTKMFHEQLYGFHQIKFLKGRLTFKGAPAPAPFPSMVVIIKPARWSHMLE